MDMSASHQQVCRVGNHDGINWNGKLLLRFGDHIDLLMLNRDVTLCQGTFTKITPNQLMTACVTSSTADGC